eukprot:scaffold206959_cov26-Tisochrysis_lutea.AAC.1
MQLSALFCGCGIPYKTGHGVTHIKRETCAKSLLESYPATVSPTGILITLQRSMRAVLIPSFKPAKHQTSSKGDAPIGGWWDPV